MACEGVDAAVHQHVVVIEAVDVVAEHVRVPLPAGRMLRRRGLRTVAQRRLRQLGERERRHAAHPRAIVGVEVEEGAELHVARVLVEDHPDHPPPGLGVREHLVERTDLALEVAEIGESAPGGVERRQGREHERQGAPPSARRTKQRGDQQRHHQGVPLVELPHPADRDRKGEVEQGRERRPDGDQPPLPRPAVGLAPLRPGEQQRRREEREQRVFVLGATPDVEQRIGQIAQRRGGLLEGDGHRLVPAHRLRMHHRAAPQPQGAEHDDRGRPDELVRPLAHRPQPRQGHGCERGRRGEEDECGEMQIEERHRGQREQRQRPPRGRLRLAHRQRQRPERQGHRGQVVEEADEERLAPEERAGEEREAGVGLEGFEQRPQRIGEGDGDAGEQDQIGPLRRAERKRQQRAEQVIEQVLRLPEREREVLLRLPGGVEPVPQRPDGGHVLRQISEGQVRRGPEWQHGRGRADAQQPLPERMVLVGPAQGCGV